MNLHKFFHGDEIFSFPCVLDSKDGVLLRIPNVPSHNTIVAWAMGVSVLSGIATFPKPKFRDDNDRMPAARRTRRQTCVCSYQLISIVIHFILSFKRQESLLCHFLLQLFHALHHSIHPLHLCADGIVPAMSAGATVNHAHMGVVNQLRILAHGFLPFVNDCK